MRVYLPAGRAMLRELADDARLPADPQRPAYAVTPAVCAELGVGPEDEEGEYAVLTAAALDALDLVDPDRGVPRRVVLVVEAKATVLEGAAVSLPHEVPLSRVKAIHVDHADAEPVVRAARTGDAAARTALEDHDLGWFATQELDVVLESLEG